MGKIAIGFGAILLVSSVTSLVSVLADRQVRDKASVVVEQTLPTLSCINEIDRSARTIQLAAFSLYGATLSVSGFDSEVAKHSDK
jgi:hypothetical protein